MTDRLSDEQLVEADRLAVRAHDLGGEAQELGDLTLALVAEVRAAREREAGALVQYGHRFRGEPINPFKVGTSRAFVEGHAIAESTADPEGEVPEVLKRRVFYGPWEEVSTDE